eukprot:COSAG05_NODE_8690_length_680_cov_1.234079_1_plen_34_part_01
MHIKTEIRTGTHRHTQAHTGTHRHKPERERERES